MHSEPPTPTGPARYRRRFTASLVLLCAAISAPLHAETRLPSIFRNNMVLQREKFVAIYGEDNAGQLVTVQFAGQTRSIATNGAGKWKVYLDPMQAGGPHQLTISGSSTRSYSGVMVGEVWLLSGQSNISISIENHGYMTEATDEQWPNLRHFAIDEQVYGWVSATGDEHKRFSALGFFFGEELHRETGVPVGLVRAAYPGAHIEQFMDPLTLAENAPIDPGRAPGLRWNTLVQHVIEFTYRGVLWNQGEQNESDSQALYGEYVRDLIRNWRTINGDQDLYFVITGMPTLFFDHTGNKPQQDEPVEASARYPNIRQAQNDALVLPKVGLVPTIHISDGDLHPRNKEAVGELAATLVRGFALGEAIEWSGPVLDYVEGRGNELLLHFRHTGGGLVIDGPELLGMAIAGSDNAFHWAQGRIENNTLVLSSPQVPQPTQARYMWADNVHPIGNLRNGAGLAANSFRTDDFMTPYASLLESAPALELSFEIDNDRRPVLRFPTGAGVYYRIQTSSGLDAFQTELQVSGSGSTHTWRDFDTPLNGNTPKFYRVLRVEQ